MKRVQYLAGAIGLAPAAFGLVAGHAADAAVASPQHDAKTVSLYHVVPGGARTAAVSSSSSSSSSSSGGVSPGTATAGCTGNVGFKITKVGNVKGHGWYRNTAGDVETCIGTVDVHLWFNKTLCKSASLRVSVNKDAGMFYSAAKRVCGTAGHGESVTFPVHTNVGHFPLANGVWVCASSTFATHPACAEVGS